MQGDEGAQLRYAQGDQYWLVIGNQRLAGKVEKLADPLAVFRKEVSTSQLHALAGSSDFAYR